MKLRSVRYLTGEGIKSMWANRLMSIASVGVLVACMVLIGLAILISLNVNKALGALEQQNVIMAYFNDLNSVLYGNASDSYVPSSSTSSGDEEDSSKTDSKDDKDSSSSSKASSGSSSKTSSKTSSKNSSSSKDKEDKESNPSKIPEDAYLIHNEKEALALCEKLRKIDNVLTVEYVSSEEGLESIKEGLLDGKDQYFTFLDGEYGNPLSAAARITLKDMSKFKETVAAIEKVEGIDSIQSQSDLADKINAIKNGIGVAGIWIIAILLIISLVIVSNTIRVTMYNRKLEISIMKAVGATNSFIRLPFVIEGVTIGMLSSIFSMGILYFCYRVAMEAIKEELGVMDIIGFSEVALMIFGVFVAIGVLSGIVGSVIMISKYLKKEGSEFTAI